MMQILYEVHVIVCTIVKDSVPWLKVLNQLCAVATTQSLILPCDPQCRAPFCAVAHNALINYALWHIEHKLKFPLWLIAQNQILHMDIRPGFKWIHSHVHMLT